MKKGRAIALVVGLIYTALTVAGLIALPEAPQEPRDPADMFLGFGVSALLTIFHGALGLGGLAAGAFGSNVAVRAYGAWLAAGGLALTAYGLPAVIATNPTEMLNIGWSNVACYAATTLIGVFLAYGRPIRRESPVEIDEGRSPV